MTSYSPLTKGDASFERARREAQIKLTRIEKTLRKHATEPHAEVREQVLKVTDGKGTPFRVKFVFCGQPYGLEDCFIHYNEEPLIEFYDHRYFVSEANPDGQFVARCDATAVLELEDGYGLCLHDGSPSWSIDAATMKQVKDWIGRVWQPA